MRLRWDRISLLLCALLLLVVLAVRSATAGGPEDGRGDGRAAAASIHRASERLSASGGCPASPGTVVRASPGTGRTVALTFDDGPSRWTPQILDVLREHRVRATFFVIGQQVIAAPDVVAEAAADGHLIGNHTWSHRPPSRGRAWDAAFLSREQRRAGAAIRAAIGVDTCWFRPPEGVIAGVAPISRRAGLEVALWSVDTGDWRVARGGGTHEAAAGVHAVTTAAAAGSREDHPVILLHDGGGHRAATVAALPSIIRFYRDRGYTFVRLDGR
jgi:peptidoglycan/xylan/chitin deacetylase (PgdA/CDA1 family)